MSRAQRRGFRVGRGIADITGEASGCGMLGYGKARQQTAGLHTRLRSRAFVFAAGADADFRGEDGRGEDGRVGDGEGACVLLVVNEMPLPMDSVTHAVLERLEQLYGRRYRAENTMITATHTHCAPGGYSHHAVYNSNTGGFRPATFAAIVDGTVEAIARAHADLRAAELVLARGELHDASVNRSPTAFALNPAAERAVFPDAIDPATTMLSIRRDGRFVGGVNFFATHGTSMTNENTLISSDNKGYAAYHWERLVTGVDYLADDDPAVVTAFAQTNAGDMSPNLDRAPGRGPTDDEVENTRLIGLRQYEAAARLAAGSGERMTGGVDARLTWLDLADADVDARWTGDGRAHRTGPAVAAAAQFAGTDEGPGFAGFRQGRNPVWDALSACLVYPFSARLRDSHAPKGIVAPVGALNRIHPMVAERVPVQLLRIGQLYLIGIPGEVTITAGLRLRRTVARIVGAELQDVLIAGYANAYIHYVTTPEEYGAQRYEGGSTMFGRWELAAFTQTVAALATAMRDEVPVATGARPPSVAPAQWGRRRRRMRPDEAGPGGFGRVLIEPHAIYRSGEQVTVCFVSTDLSDDVRRGSSFLSVERDDPAGWTRVADDGDWQTVLRWMRVGRAGARVTVVWTVPPVTRPGYHRIVHDACSRSSTGALGRFTGVTRSFEIR